MLFGRLAIHREGSAIVGDIAAVGGTEIENVKLPVFGGCSIAGRSARGIHLVVVAERMGQCFARFVVYFGLFSEDFHTDMQIDPKDPKFAHFFK